MDLIKGDGDELMMIWRRNTHKCATWAQILFTWNFPCSDLLLQLGICKKTEGYFGGNPKSKIEKQRKMNFTNRRTMKNNDEDEKNTTTFSFFWVFTFLPSGLPPHQCLIPTSLSKFFLCLSLSSACCVSLSDPGCFPFYRFLYSVSDGDSFLYKCRGSRPLFLLLFFSYL